MHNFNDGLRMVGGYYLFLDDVEIPSILGNIGRYSAELADFDLVNYGLVYVYLGSDFQFGFRPLSFSYFIFAMTNTLEHIREGGVFLVYALETSLILDSSPEGLTVTLTYPPAWDVFDRHIEKRFLDGDRSIVVQMNPSFPRDRFEVIASVRTDFTSWRRELTRVHHQYCELFERVAEIHPGFPGTQWDDDIREEFELATKLCQNRNSDGTL